MTVAVEVKDEVRAANDRFCDAFKRGAPWEMAAMYTAEALLLPPGGEVVRGFDAIENFWHGSLDMTVTDLSLQTLELDVEGETAIEVGCYVLWDKNDRRADEGHYVVVWKQDHGMWKLHRDIWNSGRVG